MSDLVPARTVRQAKAREKRILDGVAEIQPFIQDRDWELLGYQSFVEWSDAKLFPVLDALDATVKRELQPELHRALREPDPVTKRQLTTREIAGRTGAHHSTVEEHLKVNTGGKPPYTILDAEIVDDPRDLRTVVEEWKAEQPPAEPTNDPYGPNEHARAGVDNVLFAIGSLRQRLRPDEGEEPITDDTKAVVRAGLVKAKNLLGEIKKEMG